MRPDHRAAIPGPRSLTAMMIPAAPDGIVETAIAIGVRAGGCHRLLGVGEQVHEHRSNPLAIGDDRGDASAIEPRRRLAVDGDGPTASSHRRLMSVGAHSKRIGRAKSSTSWTRRFSRAISSSISPAASQDRRIDPGRVIVRSAPLMIISGLRTSWAMTVDIRPRADSRSRWAASRWNRVIASVRLLKVRASTCASSSGHQSSSARVSLRVRSPLSRDLPHVVGDAGERPGDGAGDAEAQATARSTEPMASPTRKVWIAASVRAGPSASGGRSPRRDGPSVRDGGGGRAAHSRCRRSTVSGLVSKSCRSGPR